ncbi:MAG: hypothetical protein ACRDFX_06130, partial [Chloroflexota bacterium]
LSVRDDVLRGAVLVTGAIQATRAYRIPAVASISAPDVMEGARADVLAAFARAALVTRHHLLVLSRTHHWSGYLLRWHGRTVLVGRGEKGSRVELRLAAGRGGVSLHRVRADPKTGAYAIDLGSLTRQQYQRLKDGLIQSQRKNVRPIAQAVVPRAVQAVAVPSNSGGNSWPVFFILALVAGAAALAGVSRLRQRG